MPKKRSNLSIDLELYIRMLRASTDANKNISEFVSMVMEAFLDGELIFKE
jgi:hypothetical protein